MEPNNPATVDGLASLWSTAQDLEQQVNELTSGLDAAEGQRFLLRMLRASIETYVEQSDAQRPEFHPAESPTRKMFADCPDADYLRAPIALGPGRVYRLRGRVPADALYVGVLLYGRGGRIGNRLIDEQLELDDDGRFDLLIATEEQPGTWLRAEGDDNAVLVRQYFSDRDRQQPLQLKIDLVGPAAPAAPLSAPALAERVAQAERMLKAVFRRTVMAYKMATTAAVNRFIEVPGEQLFPTPDNRYCVAWYRLAPGQRALVRGRIPRARYFGLTLYNAWLESLDYRLHQVSLNHEQIKAAPDGSFEVCLAPRAPQHDNWLDTVGHAEGYVLARGLLPDEPMPQLELVLEPDGS